VFKILITEWWPASQNDDRIVPEVMERYSQSVDAIDLPKIIAAVNSRPRKAREPKAQPVKKEGTKNG
jgi:hypothetical protein